MKITVKINAFSAFQSIFITLLSFFTIACPLLQAKSLQNGKEHGALNFIKKGTIQGQVRSFYMHRHFDKANTSESMALGGYLKYETASWHGLSAGVVGYTSQGLMFTDKNHDGADLLAPGQQGYGVIGQAYLQAEAGKNSLRLFRQMLDTPFLNPYDFRMTPVTFEAYTLKSNMLNSFQLQFSHVTRIKEWTDRKFRPMSEAAGFTGTNEPVTMAGIIYTPAENCTIQIWDYFCHEFMNVIYAQADIKKKISIETLLSGSAQAMYQKDVGKALEGEFHTGMAGIQGGIAWRGLELTLGFTITDDNYDIVNPWGAYPGYTSIMEEDNDLAGEKSWVFGLSFDFGKIGIKGLSANTNHTESWTPENGSFSSPAQRETDLTVDYLFHGGLHGLCLRMRAAFVEDSLDTDSEDYKDYRIILNYSF
ncbi:MAG: OprD family outer membrane porin [Candidatus Theseobacter exili]|nr:OprD family outer membrane porin [Candidatus Theseobacter exili]